MMMGENMKMLTLPRLKLFFVFAVLVILVSACAGESARTDAAKWVAYVCGQADPAVRSTLIRQTERTESQTFRCPVAGKPVNLSTTGWHFIDPDEALRRQGVSDLTVEKVNQVCSMAPGPERDDYMRQMKEAKIYFTCPDKTANTGT
jgi:hypothetical protein